MDGWGCMPPTEGTATPPYGPCRKDKTKLASPPGKKDWPVSLSTMSLGLSYSDLCKVHNKKNPKNPKQHTTIQTVAG